jgi:hypothetical protein
MHGPYATLSLHTPLLDLLDFGGETIPSISLSHIQVYTARTAGTPG